MTGRAEELVRRMDGLGLTFGTAESCTGGGVGSAVCAIPGASAVFRGGIISYATEVKRDVLGVRAEVLEREGPVSAACAAEMAIGARRLLKADYVVSVTGLAGPDGDGVHPVGCVWFGLASAAGVRTQNRVFPGDREGVRAAAVEHALGMLLDEVSGVKAERG